MILASWFSSTRHSRGRLTRIVARRNRSRAFHRRVSFEALEDRRLLSTVSFTGDSEITDESAGSFSIPVTLSDNVSTIGFDWAGPIGLASDSAGNLYVYQSDDAGTVSKVTPEGVISKFAAGFQPLGERAGDLAFGPNGNLYVANPGANAVNEVTPQGKISTFVTGLNNAYGLAFDSAGNLYVSDPEDNTISKVTPQAKISAFASGLDRPTGLAFGPDGFLYVANKSNGTIVQLDSGGHPVNGGTITNLSNPDALAFDSAGNLYVADAGTGYVDEVAPGFLDAVVTGLADPDGLAFDSSGNLYVAEFGGGGTLGTVSEYSAPVSVTYTLGGTAQPGVAYSGVTAGSLTFGIGFTTEYIIGSLLSDPGPSQTLTFTLDAPSGGSATLGSPSVNTLTITEPPTVQFSAGSETVNESTGRFSIPVTLSGPASGTVSVPFTLSGTAVSGTAFSGVTANSLTFQSGVTTEDITGTLLSDAGLDQTLTFTLGSPTGGGLGSSSVNTLTITEPGRVQFSTGSETVNESAGTFSIPVTLSATPTVAAVAAGDQPDGLAVDSAGNLYVANLGDGTVSKVTPAGVKTTFASGLENPGGLVFDAAGNLYIANSIENTVMMVTPQGVMSTFATGLNTPFGLAFDSAGNLYVSNVGNSTVSELSRTGLPIATITGFNLPSALAVDGDGNLYVANLGDGTVSKVSPGGKPATFASGFNDPTGLIFDSAGNLYVANNGDGTLSKVPPAGGTSTTFVSGFNGPFGLAFAAGDIYVANNVDNTVSEVSETAIVRFSVLGGAAAAGTAFSGVTAGPLKFEIGQTTLEITGRLFSDPGPSQTLTFSLGTPTGDTALGSLSVNTLIVTEPAKVPTPTPTELPPVFIGEQRVFSGKGKHKKLLGFEFLFNGALNTSGAQSTGNYRVAQKQGKKAKVLRVKSALYNPSNFSVTISVSGFNAGEAAQATITGLEGADGAAIPEIVSGL